MERKYLMMSNDALIIFHFGNFEIRLEKFFAAHNSSFQLASPAFRAYFLLEIVTRLTTLEMG